MGDELTPDEIAVIMQMSGDLGYPAAQIAADLAHEQPKGGWTRRKVSNIQRELFIKRYAEFGPLTCEDTGELRGRGYWLSNKGCNIRYRAKEATDGE